MTTLSSRRYRRSDTLASGNDRRPRDDAADAHRTEREAVAHRTEREAVAGLAHAVAHFAAVEEETPEGLARLRAAHLALEAAGVDMARRHTGTRSDNDAQALLRRRVGGGA